jgi:hypothetical protein
MKTLSRTLVLATALIGSSIISPLSMAANFNVTSLADSGAGTLRQAVLDANANAGADTIQIGIPGTITLSSELLVTESVAITGPGARSLTVSGNNATRILELDNVSAKDVTLTDMTFAAANASGNGGAILNGGGNLLLQRMRITGNTASGEGGAIYNAYFAPGNVLTIEDSELSGNHANKEGAIYFIGYQLRISNSTLSGNSATDSVGAIGLQFGDAVIRNSSIVGNSANFVGGIQAQDSQLVLESTILAQNTDSTGTNDINRTGSGTTSASNSLFSEDVNATSVINGTNSANLIGVAPQLGPLANNGGPTNSHIPLAGSPAVGAGSNSQNYAYDQRGSGYPRDAGGAVDIGAIQQYVAPPPTVSIPALTPAALAGLALLLGAIGIRRLKS